MPLIRYLAVILLFSPAALAQTKPLNLNEAPPGGLYLATEIPGQVVAAPNVKTKIDVDITGPITRTRVVQYFTNPGDAFVEGVYTYPLPKGAAVDTLKMQIGERVIEGEIKEKAEAQKTYDAARNAGQRASLVVQHRPNVFSTKLANIGPHETIAVQIEFQNAIAPRDGVFSLRLPLVVRPRYNPGVPLGQNKHQHLWGVDTDQVPDGSTVTQPLNLHPSDTDNPVDISIHLIAGFDLADLASPSHKIDVQESKEGGLRITLAEGTVPADRDFLLSWKPSASQAPSTGIFHEQTAAGHHYLLMLMPATTPLTASAAPARDLVIVLDKSGSMGGQAILQAKAAVRRALRKLKAADSFNLIAFDHTAAALFPASQPATEGHLEQAYDFLDRIEADGGTEMSAALGLALAGTDDEPAFEHLKQIIFITDGAVGNEKALMAQIKRDLGKARLFTLGIGSAPNNYFMSEAAHFGRGTHLNLAMNDDLTASMNRLFAKIEAPQLTDIALQGLGEEVEVVPSKVPDLYAGDPIVIALKSTTPLTGALKVTGRMAGAPWQMETSLQKIPTGNGVSQLWARRKIATINRAYIGDYAAQATENRRNEILGIALPYHLVSDFTSLVAVEKTETRPDGAPLFTRHIAANLPAGMDWGIAKAHKPDTRRLTLAYGAMPPPAQEAVMVSARSTASPMMLHILMGLALLALGFGLLFWQRALRTPGA